MAIIFNPLEFSSALSIICDPDPAGKIPWFLGSAWEPSVEALPPVGWCHGRQSLKSIIPR